MKRTEIEDSPFVVVTSEEGSFVAMGKYRLSEIFEHEETAINEANQITWNRIIQVMMILKQHEDEMNQFKNPENEQ